MTARKQDPEELAQVFLRVRRATSALAAPLSAEDQMIQSMSLVSPTKWHLAHTTWFFEHFVLAPHVPGYRRSFPESDRLFNSYYESVGAPRDRTLRSTLSRPSAEEIVGYRRRVDEEVARALPEASAEVRELVVLGINHEEQHQELILTDIKHGFSTSPLLPAYRKREGDPPPAATTAAATTLSWQSFQGGPVEIGHSGAAFAFDNERPRHSLLLTPFRLARRLVTCGEYRSFMEDGGYRRPELWLSDGWQAARSGGWTAPLYWQSDPGVKPGADPWHLTLHGLEPVRMDEPVTHVSFYEADAYARWAGARLPRESEWEHAAASLGDGIPAEANLLESGRLHPAPPPAGKGPDALGQMFGDVWQWTQSPYVEYPGYRRPSGALGEYNGKFMCNQLVLRGGSCVTPRRHLRASYRNFFPPDARWQFSGIRLAADD